MRRAPVTVDVPVVTWHGCYDGGWKGLIVPGAFAHPAKMARGLVARIFDELFEMGALKAGDVVADPFTGIGSTGIEAASRGVRFYGVELEPKFVRLASGHDCLGFTKAEWRRYAHRWGRQRNFGDLCPACQAKPEIKKDDPRVVPAQPSHRFVGNFELHRRDWEAMGRPMPVVVQGDSRKLREVLGPVLAECVLTSPPYARSDQDYARGRTSVDWEKGARRGMKNDRISGPEAAYGDSPGQLGAMPEGSIDAVVSSPPYEESVNAQSHGIDWSKADPKSVGNRKRGDDCKHGQTLRDQLAYGKEDGQLGAMAGGAGVDAVISSPPYAEIASGAGGLNSKPAKDGQQGGRDPSSASQDTDQRYGESAGQLARLPSGDVDAIVSSPPFLDARSDTTASVKGNTPTQHDPEAMGRSNGNLSAMEGGTVDAIVCSPPYSTGDSASAQSITTRTDKSAEWVKKNCGSAATEGYGLTPGQLGVMPDGPVADALVSSPPWEKNIEGHVRGGKFKSPADFLTAGRGHGCSDEARLAQLKRDEQKTLGDSEGQLGQEHGETFWSAALLIAQESYAILKPGGVAVWVVKHFVRKGQLVDFPGDWRKLCEHVGFETFMEVHASLVAEETRPHLFDGERTVRRERKSFFRRLAEKKGSPRIDFETVLFMRKPEAIS